MMMSNEYGLMRRASEIAQVTPRHFLPQAVIAPRVAASFRVELSRARHVVLEIKGDATGAALKIGRPLFVIVLPEGAQKHVANGRNARTQGG